MRKRFARMVATTVVIGFVLVPAPVSAGGGGHCSESLGAPEAGTVSISDNCFTPAVLQVNAGETVRWLSTTGGLHTVNFREVASGDVLGEFEARFNHPGTYAYECIYHPGMVAAITVVGSAAAGEPIQPLSPPRANAQTIPVASKSINALSGTPASQIREGSHQVSLNVGLAGGLMIALGLLVAGLATATATTIAVRQARR